MKTLLLTMLFAAVIEVPGRNAPAAGERNAASNDRLPAMVVIVAEGSQEWHSLAATGSSVN